MFTGAIDVTLDDAAAVRAQSQEVFSVPGRCAGAASPARATSATEIAVVTAGDHKKHPVWSDEIVAAAAKAGYGVDHSGYVAPLRLLPLDVQNRAAA